MAEHYDIVVVGGGHAGAQAAISLRQCGYGGSIAIVGEEAELPYERPPLSKDYLAGTKSFDRIRLRPASFWAERTVSLMAGQRVVAVDPRNHLVATASGSEIGYAQLVWAAGGHARSLACPGHDLPGVHRIRSRADVDGITAKLRHSRHVAIVGAGYIGLEAAAVLRRLGKQVTLLEAQGRVLARVAGATLSDFYATEHRANGVDLRLNAIVAEISEGNGRAAGVVMAGGDEISADMVIVGIGIVPAVAPILTAGAKGGNGVEVDEFCRTSLEDIFAIGDCALHRSRFADGQPIRLESVQNANDMAATVARTITGTFAEYSAVPWFWSNQYDLRLQTAGLSLHYDQEVLRGDPANRSFSVVYLNGKRVRAVDSVNATRDYIQGKALINRLVDPSLLADASIPLKDCLIA